MQLHLGGSIKHVATWLTSWEEFVALLAVLAASVLQLHAVLFSTGSIRAGLGSFKLVHSQEMSHWHQRTTGTGAKHPYTSLTVTFSWKLV
eukprot:jgi/Chrzof1/10728/Cz05g10080.t1